MGVAGEARGWIGGDVPRMRITPVGLGPAKDLRVMQPVACSVFKVMKENNL